MTCKFYLPPGRLNAVTTYYVDVIKDAVKKAGIQVSVIQDISEIKSIDIVVTIENKDFYKVSKKHPAKQVHWFQGILPEEAAMTFKGHWSKPFRVWFNEWLEAYILRRSSVNLYVSQAMKEHYTKKYGHIKGDEIVMPCFNSELQPEVFNSERYQRPSFVYAGSLHKWQCFEPMLELFKQIKARFPAATLDIYTAETDKAAELTSLHGIDVFIDCLSPKELNQRLTQYKYGFIVRDPDPVNHVASPTKMNTYMAAGIIPVASDVVETYHTNLKSCRYVVLFNNTEELLAKIESLESDQQISSLVQPEFENVFNSFWNRKKYIATIAGKLRN